MTRNGVMVVLCSMLSCMYGCRKELCYDHDLHGLGVRVEVRTSWECVWERPYGMDWRASWPAGFGWRYEELCPQAAGGIAAVVYNGDGSRHERHLPAVGGILPMAEGTHSVLFYNDDTEFIVFTGLDSLTAASATTRVRSRSSYSESHQSEITVNTPDVLFGSWSETYEARLTADTTIFPVTMRPLVYTYLVRYEFAQGLEHVVLARGALAGMAQSVFLRDGATGGEAVTLLYDCTLEAYGAEALVRSFGVPAFADGNYTRRDDRRYGLNLEVRLSNGKIKTFDFDVTDQVVQQPRGGVITVSGISVTEEEAGGDAGFDVSVGGWGDYEDIVLPLH